MKGPKRAAALPLSTVLDEKWKVAVVGRSSSTRASELEVLLRKYCHRITVHESVNGAHIVIPVQNSKTSLAIRYYSNGDIRRLTNAFLKGDSVYTNQEMDGLKKFASAFALSLVFFVLPDVASSGSGSDNNNNNTETELLLSEELDSSQSFTRRAMDLLTRVSTDQNSSKSHRKTCIRSFVVPNAEAAVTGIKTFANALEPKTQELRKRFFHNKKIEYCIPPTNSNGDGQNTETNEQKQIRSMHISKHVRDVVGQWARRFEIPNGEDDVLMETAGNLRDITSVGLDTHEDLPIESATRQKIEMFFDRTHPEGEGGGNSQQQYHQQQLLQQQQQQQQLLLQQEHGQQHHQQQFSMGRGDQHHPNQENGGFKIHSNMMAQRGRVNQNQLMYPQGIAQGPQIDPRFASSTSQHQQPRRMQTSQSYPHPQFPSAPSRSAVAPIPQRLVDSLPQHQPQGYLTQEQRRRLQRNYTADSSDPRQWM